MLGNFWEMIDAQLKELESAKSADDVMRILGNEPGAGEAFFSGSGGDKGIDDSLRKAGWRYVWSEANYHFAMKAPDGSSITYVEGDIYRGSER
ncbi:hypothetical protein ACFRJ3_34955 [Streptomyces sp. NPDC056696]|uniref:hypothetical protein n=1 Tax=unclassified Streptomyces TaxID=2593676 RepID=UPI003669AC96